MTDLVPFLLVQGFPFTCHSPRTKRTKRPKPLYQNAIRVKASEIQTVRFEQGTLPAQIGHGTVSDDLTLVENNQPFAHRGGP